MISIFSIVASFVLVNVVSVRLLTAREINFTSSSTVLVSQTESLSDVSSSVSPTSKENTLNPCSRHVIEEYVLLDNGSVLIPENGKIYDDGAFYRYDNKLFICSEESLEAEASNQVSYNFSEEFRSCGHILLDPDEFEMLGNKSIYVDIYSRLYDPFNYFVQQEKGAYVCLPQFSEMQGNKNESFREMVKFSGPLVYVSYIGLSISIISLFLHLAVFCMVPNVRNLPGCCLASLSLSLLIAYLCFISSSIHPIEHCAALGAAIYYFFLASFFWMNVIAFDVWRSFRVVMKELRISSHRVPRRRFLAYSAYSWLLPAALAILAVKADQLDLVPDDFRPSFGYVVCWFGKRKALLVFFACPLFAIMLLNGIFFLDSTYVINRATIKTSHASEAVLRKRFFTIMRLALIMGLTWIVGIVAAYVDQEPLWYLFVILNTLQGLFILVVFSCSAKVKEFFYRKIGRPKSRRQGTSVRTISQESAIL